jgi:hypothetical protein
MKPEIRPDGTQLWWQDGKLHRLDGPAVIHSNGTRLWYQNDILHRCDGAAIIRSDGSKLVCLWGETPSSGVWNNHVITDNKLNEEFPSAVHLPEYKNCQVWWVEDLEERTLALLKYS